MNQCAHSAQTEVEIEALIPRPALDKATSKDQTWHVDQVHQAEKIS